MLKIIEERVDFLSLDDRRFEELCFALVLESGFKNVLYREGSADDGRDVEATLYREHPIVDTFSELWYFECKRYTGAVASADLLSKIAWAEARNPDHLVLITSSHLSNSCLNWLEQYKRNNSKPYRIHVINGRALRRLVCDQPKVYEQFFGDLYYQVLTEAKANWLLHDSPPSADLMFKLANNATLSLFSSEDIGFIFYFSCMTHTQWPQWNATREEPVESLRLTWENMTNSQPFDLGVESAKFEGSFAWESADEVSRFGFGGSYEDDGFIYFFGRVEFARQKSQVASADFVVARRESGELIEVVLPRSSAFSAMLRLSEGTTEVDMNKIVDELDKKRTVG